MKANESEVFNRVVNRTLYSKKVVLALTVALVMVGSAFVASMAALAVPGQADVTLEGWTLLPQPPGSPKWTPGNVKGYSEGDVVPVKLTVGVNGDDHVHITIGFEWGYGTIGDPQRRGFDVEVQYPWSGDPDPTEQAFNDPEYYLGSPDQPTPPSGVNGPFSVGPAGGATILSQEYLGPVADGSPNWKIWDEWKLEVNLDTSYEDVCLLVGGLLFKTTSDQLGAAYFPGSSLHVRMILVDCRKSSEDISLNVEEILSPPNVVLEKFNTPKMVVVGDTMKMKIMWENLAQADAYGLVLWDIIPTDDVGDLLLQYGLLGTEVGHMWSMQNGVSSPVVNVAPPELKEVLYDSPDDDPDMGPVLVWAWVWEDRDWIAKGTGQYGANPVTVYYLEFDVTVIGWDLGEQTNRARLWYYDDHNPDPCYADAHSHFTIIKPGIEITKVEKDGLTCAAGQYVMGDPQTGDPVLSPGDTITYVITVTNPSPDVAMDYKVFDDVIAMKRGWSFSLPIMSGILDPGASDSEEFTYLIIGNEEEPVGHGYKFRNTATVVAYDVYDLGEKLTVASSWDIDILHPDLSITKTACSEVAAVGEEIRYTVEVENLGDATLEEFVIYDQMMTDPILYEATQENPDDDLSPHEILILESVNSGLPGHVYVPVLAHTIVVEDVDPRTDLITNKVWIEAWDTQNHYLYREDSVSLTHVTPSIKITKTAVNDLDQEIFEIGLSGEVKYKIEVENTGDVGLWWFYWDTFADPAWTPVEKANPIWTNIGGYGVDGCWAGELSADGDGVYCGQVPMAGPGQAGVVAMSIQDTFVGDELYYEVDIFPHDSYWRAGVLLRYDEASGNGYLVHLMEGGVVMYEMNGWMLSSMGSASMAIPSGAWTTLGVRVENDINSFFDVYVDGVLVLSTSDVSPLDAGEIGLAVWDEGHNAVHVHFDNVLVTDLDGNVLLRDSFEMLEPELMPPSTPAIPFPVSPALPGGLACYYQARLASGYLARTGTEVTYYTYEVQDDDPDPLENTVIVLGWITTDGTEQAVVQDPHYFVWDCDDASVRILGWIDGFVYHDYDLNDVEKEGTDSALDGWTVHLYEPDLANPGDWIERKSFTTGSDGYYLFDYLPPGPYMVKVDIYSTDYFSTNPKDLSDPDGLWEDVSVIAGFGSHQDFGMAEYAYLKGYKWNDWNMNRNRDQPGGVWEPYLDGWVIMCAGWEYDELVNGDPPPGVDPHHEQTAITGEDGISGWFQFKVKPGIWTIWEVMPEDDPLTPLIDESAWFQTFPTTPGTHENVEIDEGSTISDKHFGNVPLTTIWGYKYYDKIGLNGVRDEGDIGLEGWTITLDDGNQLTPILTDVTGRRSVDVMFAIDLSGSLADDIAQIRAAVTNIMAALASAGVDARFGVVSFVDYPDEYSTTEIGSVPETYSAVYGDESSGDYAYQLDQPLTSDTDDVEDVMDSLSIYYGGDGPQDYARVVHEAWNDASVGWRYCTERVLVLFGDNAAHDSDFDVYGDGTNVNTGGDPGRDELLNTDDDLDFETEVANAAAHGVHIMSVYVPGTGVSHEWEYMASETGGKYFTLAGVGDVPDAILDLVPLGYFVFTGLKPGTYTLGEVEPLGQEDYWYITTPQGQLHITISKPTVPGTKIHQDIGNMRLAKVWGYKFVDEYGGDLANPTYPNGLFDANEWGYGGWPIHWKLVGALVEADGSPTHTMEDIVATSLENERGRYSIMLVPGDYEIWEEVLEGWQATTPWKVWITIPAHPWGSPIVKKLDFGNTRPLSDPEVPFWLESGWNLWSSPVTTDGLTAKGLLAKIGSAAKIVTKYQETTGNYSTYRVNWPDSYDFPIIAGDGYYVYVTTDAFFTLVGDAIGASNIALVAGWNLVGYDKIEPVKASQLLGMVTGCNAKIVTYYDQYTNTYISYRKGWPSAYDFYVVPGRAYFICTDGAGTLVSS